MKASSISASARSINLLVLVAAVVLSVPTAHAQTSSSTAEPGTVDTSLVTGAVIDGTGAGNRPGVNAGNSTVATDAAGATGTGGPSVQGGRAKSATSSEPTPWHPLTDF